MPVLLGRSLYHLGVGFAGRFLAAVVLSCVGVGSAYARIETPFDVEDCSWGSTHVVVANVLDEVDKVEVVESWHGDLAAGTRIVVPGLHQLRTEENRAVSKRFHEEAGTADLVSATRAIFYLVGERGAAEWRPARRHRGRFPGSLQISLAWVEGEDVFAFRQLMNPGHLELVRFGKLEEVKTTTLRVLEERDSFAKAVALEKPPEERAAALAPVLSSSAWIVSGEAWEALDRLGGAALPVVRGILKDPARVEIHARAIEVLSKHGGAEVEAELTKIVEAETAALWEKKNFHEDVAHAAVKGLDRFRTHDCESAVVALRDLCAVSNSKLGLECDRVLQHLAGEPKPRR
jgi:hypothetical protein